MTTMPRIQQYQGDRRELRALFELAEDSSSQLDSYFHLGRVLVALLDEKIVGHLQVVPTGNPEKAEIKNMAVLPSHQNQGIGRALIETLVELLTDASVTSLLVATAAADIDKPTFQRMTVRSGCVGVRRLVVARRYRRARTLATPTQTIGDLMSALSSI